MIEKNIFVLWNHRNILEDNHPLLVNGVHNLKKLNPDWKFHIVTPQDMKRDIFFLVSEEEYKLIIQQDIPSISDFWRAIKLYEKGGVYMDIDRFCNIPLSEILEPGIKWILPTMKDYDFSHDIMITASRNPVMKLTADLYLERLKEGIYSQYFLGPQTYMHAITKTFFGTMINTDPGKEIFDKMREEIANYPFIKLYREEPPNDMILYRGEEGHLVEEYKRDFYKKEKVKHWTNEW